MIDQNLLDILQAHGQQFLNSFSLPSTQSGPKKRKRSEDEYMSSIVSTSQIINHEEEEEEWGGIAGANDNDINDSGFAMISEDDESMTTNSCNNSNVVVFQDICQKTEQHDSTSRFRMKAFMSSRVSELRQESSRTARKEKTEEDLEDEHTNAQNDAMLHRLIHTKLLSGSLDSDLDMAPARRRKAMAGRLLELSGAAKLGKGENYVRNMERNKASKRVRDGLKEKQKQRAMQRLEEAKNLGNYHPTLKKSFEHSEALSNKKRERGLGMGVGKFRDGFLQLRQEDLRMVNGGNLRHHRNGGKRGRGRVN
ncbi:hypothetical protein C0993_004350 [Termitomyces sp. T159_Od127]|nr:hypothetical protein C0993_004350 [Termitomyces sp. T159_Od127]